MAADRPGRRRLARRGDRRLAVEHYSWSAGVVAAVMMSALGAVVLLARRNTLSAQPLTA